MTARHLVSLVACAALSVAAMLSGCEGSSPDVYQVDWGIAPKSLTGCDTLIVDGDLLLWSGPGCDEPALVGEPNTARCSWYEERPGTGWWICADVDSQDLVGERLEGGQVVADFVASNLKGW